MRESQLIPLLNKTDGEMEGYLSCDSVLYGYSPRRTLSQGAFFPLVCLRDGVIMSVTSGG